MIRTPEAQGFDIKTFYEQQKLHEIASCFGRNLILGYLTDTLGYMTRDEIERLGQQLYSDTLAGQSRPVGAVLKKIGLIRKSEQLHYLRTFLGSLDQMFANTLRSIHGHDILMSSVALEYGKEEMEEKLGEPGRPMRSATDWLAGEGPRRPLMIAFIHLSSQGLVNIQGDNGREVVLPTYRMAHIADSLEEIIQSPLILDREILLVAGRLGTRAVARS